MVTSITVEQEIEIDILQSITRLEARIEPFAGTPVSQIIGSGN